MHRLDYACVDSLSLRQYEQDSAAVQNDELGLSLFFLNEQCGFYNYDHSLLLFIATPFDPQGAGCTLIRELNNFF